MPKLLKAIGGFFLDFIETIVIALSVFLIVYLTLVQPHQVDGQSMEPNFLSGEYLLTDKVSYKFREPKAGEVVVFHAPDGAHCPEGTGCDYIKRILAVPGDTVEVTNDSVIVNGSPLSEPYIPEDFETRAGSYTKNRTITLQPGEYFTVGDNREYSSDSREWGPTPLENIVGRAFFRYWPLNVAGMIKAATY